jgi:hypothetical protein
MMQQGHTEDAHGELHHEASDVDSGRILRFGVWFVVVLAVVYGVVWVIFGAFDRREASGSVRDFPLSAERSAMPPQPRLQMEPRQEMRALRQRDQELLTTYGWANREAGLVRIPIERAMQLTVERGLPVREPAPAAAPGGARP